MENQKDAGKVRGLNLDAGNVHQWRYQLRRFDQLSLKYRSNLCLSFFHPLRSQVLTWIQPHKTSQ